MKPGLTALQVATLLVSASYGIGFLFGTGELALQWGMAASIYAIVTAVGIAVLGLTAARLWHGGLQIWEVLGQAYGATVSKLVALLSVVWMGGVLAAQIHGGVAVVKLMGLPGTAAYAVMLGLIYGASRMNLGLASRVFGLCLAASSLLLLYALFSVNGLPVLAQAVPSFVQDLQRVPMVRLWVIVLAIAPLVVTGADYQQFVIAAKGPRAAVYGCLLAAGFLLVFGFVPASVVVAYAASAAAQQPDSGSQIMPFIMASVSRGLAPGYEWVVLVGLLVAALGSAAAVVRAMVSAVLSATGPRQGTGLVSLAIVLGGGLVASRGQSIIDTMVALNIVYLGAIGVVFVALFTPWKLSPRAALSAMVAGFSASMAAYLAGWSGWLAIDADLLSLCAGLLASLCVGGWQAWRASRGAAPARLQGP